ncbi:MAG: WYL domain-containing protein [Deltaproteobacteria bacterium]|jgi:predicted DNA-binding transcriptional regulator YafY|nr:WYL domain-containing protein [Deltaproteobacteria bacterium]
MSRKLSDRTAGEKLLRLFSLLIFNPGRQFSLRELADYLDCSKQTVLRLKDGLEASEFGKLTESRRGREAVYCLERPRGLPALDMSAEGLEQLVLCRNFLLHLLPKGRHSPADQALAAAGAPAPEIAGLTRLYTKGRIDYAPYQATLQTLLRAMRENRACLLSHQAAQRAPRTFLFAPKRLVAYHETLSALGWEITDEGEARFPNPVSLYLHRIREARLSRRTTARLPTPLPAETGNEEYFGVMPGTPFTVKARFTRDAADYVRERQWNSRQSCATLEDGSIILEFEAQSRVEALSWLLSFGAKATVLAPEELREELYGQAREVAKNYA